MQVSRFILKKNPSVWMNWRIYPYSRGWFYKSREFPGLKYIEIESGYGGGIFLGDKITIFYVMWIFSDVKKSMDLPAPKDPILLALGRNYSDCNTSASFNMDLQVSDKFHEVFARKHQCHIPFLGGDRYVQINAAQTSFCTNMSNYNTTEGD